MQPRVAAFGSLTKEEQAAELEKGMADIRAGRTYSAQSISLAS